MVTLLIDKEDTATIEKLEAAIEAATKLGKSTKWGNKVPRNLKLPLRDGDEERDDDPAFEGMYFINASSNRAPGIVDQNREAVLSEEGFYSGCYGRASINFYPFAVSGNKGVACGLNNLQFLEDGERLSGNTTSAEDDFADDFDDLS